MKRIISDEHSNYIVDDSENKFASKGVAGAGLGTGIGGLATGVLAAIVGLFYI